MEDQKAKTKLMQDDEGNKDDARVIGWIFAIISITLPFLAIYKESEIAADLVWPFISVVMVVFTGTKLEKKWRNK